MRNMLAINTKEYESVCYVLSTRTLVHCTCPVRVQRGTYLDHDVRALPSGDFKHGGQNVQHVIPCGVILVTQTRLCRFEDAMDDTLFARLCQLVLQSVYGAANAVA